MAGLILAGRFLLAAQLWFLAFYFGGVACVIVGINRIAGEPYAFVVAGVLFIATAALIRREISRG